MKIRSAPQSPQVVVTAVSISRRALDRSGRVESLG